MELEGLDYNTKREKLALPEYGRQIQRMVDFTKQLPTKELRQKGANTIIALMQLQAPKTNNSDDRKRTLWDHLYMMGGGELDIDWPYDMSEADLILKKPNPTKVSYGSGNIRNRHYGKLLEEVFEELQKMPDGPEKEELICLTANQMKRCLVVWGHGSVEDSKVADDLYRLTKGAASIDPQTFHFDKVEVDELADSRQAKKKRK